MSRATVEVRRNVGHPWDNRPGFDMIVIDARDQAALDVAVATAERKFWRPWLLGVNDLTQRPGGVMYKPCDITQDWADNPQRPHPGCPRRTAPAAR